MVFTIVWGREREGARVMGTRMGMGTDVAGMGWGRDRYCGDGVKINTAGRVGNGDKLLSPWSSLVTCLENGISSSLYTHTEYWSTFDCFNQVYIYRLYIYLHNVNFINLHTKIKSNRMFKVKEDD